MSVGGGSEAARLEGVLALVGLPEFIRGMQHAGGETDTAGKKVVTFEKHVRNVGETMSSVGKSMSFRVTAPIVAGFTASAKSAADLDLSLHKINSLTGLTGKAAEKSLGMFRTQVGALSNSLGVAQTTLSDGLYQAISSGIPRQNAMTFMTVASKAAIAGITDTQTSVDALSTAVNSFKDQNLTAAHAADVMFQTVNAGKIEFPELAQYIGQVTGFADVAHVSIDELGAAIATMTIKGIPGRVAITDLKLALMSVLKPTKEMTHAYKELGVKGWDELLKRKGSMQAAFQAIAATAKGNTGALIKMFGTSEAATAILDLTGKNAKDASLALTAMGKSAGAAGIAFQELNKSDARKFEMTKVALQNVGIAIGADLMPSLLRGAQEVLHLTNEFQQLDAGTRHTIEIVAGLGAAMGPGLMALGAMTQGTGMALQGVRMLGTGIGSLAMTVGNAVPALEGLALVIAANPLIAGGVAIAAIAGATIAFMSMHGEIDATTASIRANDAAVRALDAGLDKLAGTNLRSAQSHLAVKQAQAAAAGSQIAYNSAVQQFGRHSSQAHAAALNLQSAQLSARQATLDAEAATRANNREIANTSHSVDKAKQALGGLKQQMYDLLDAEQEVRRGNVNGTMYGAGSNEARAALKEIIDAERRLQVQIDQANGKLDRESSKLKALGPAATGSLGPMRELHAQLDSLHDKSVNLTVKVTKNNLAGNPMVPQLKATGGPIIGEGTGTSDSIPAMLSNGEFVVRADGSNLSDALSYYGAPGYKRGGHAHKGAKKHHAPPTHGKDWPEWLQFHESWNHKKAQHEHRASGMKGAQKHNFMAAFYGGEYDAFKTFLHKHGALTGADKIAIHKAMDTAFGKSGKAASTGKTPFQSMMDAFDARDAHDDYLLEMGQVGRSGILASEQDEYAQLQKLFPRLKGDEHTQAERKLAALYHDIHDDKNGRGVPQDTSSSSGSSASDNPDLAAQLEQQRVRTANAQAEASAAARELATFGGSGDIGGAGYTTAMGSATNGAANGSRATVVIQALHPGDPSVLQAIDRVNRQSGTFGGTTQQAYHPRVGTVG